MAPTVRVKCFSDNNSAPDTADKSNPLWHIPITICSASSPNEAVTKVMMTKAEEEFSLVDCAGIAPGDWIKLNAGLKGFYRVIYDDVSFPIYTE